MCIHSIIINGRAIMIIYISIRNYLKGVIPLDHEVSFVGLISIRFLLQNMCRLYLERSQYVPYCKSGITMRNQRKIIFAKCVPSASKACALASICMSLPG